MVHSKKFR